MYISLSTCVYIYIYIVHIHIIFSLSITYISKGKKIPDSEMLGIILIPNHNDWEEQVSV